MGGPGDVHASFMVENQDLGSHLDAGISFVSALTVLGCVLCILLWKGGSFASNGCAISMWRGLRVGL